MAFRAREGVNQISAFPQEALQARMLAGDGEEHGPHNVGLQGWRNQREGAPPGRTISCSTSALITDTSAPIPTPDKVP